MNIIDVVIILLILSGAAIGFKRGFTRQVVSSIGMILVVVLAFLLKNPLSIFLYEHLPFFKFGGILKGVTVLNIFIYEMIAFLIVMSILIIVLKVLISATKIFETLLKFTVILTLPSKIGGMIVGIIESYVWTFLLLFVLTLPFFKIPEFENSSLKNKIVNGTPILSNFTEKTTTVVTEFLSLKEKYETTPNASEFNRETLDLFLKYDVITVDSVIILRDRDKIKMDNLDELINKYKEES